MHTSFRPAIMGALATAVLLTTTISGAFAKVGDSVYEGLVKHVSANNIKVYNPKDKRAESFLILPKFKQVFSDDGKTTTQMSALHAGQYVKVYYDQKLLGARHADRILIMSSNNMKMGKQ